MSATENLKNTFGELVEAYDDDDGDAKELLAKKIRDSGGSMRVDIGDDLRWEESQVEGYEEWPVVVQSITVFLGEEPVYAVERWFGSEKVDPTHTGLAGRWVAIRVDEGGDNGIIELLEDFGLSVDEPDVPPWRSAMTNPCVPDLPQKFWQIRDQAVENVLTGSPLPADLADLQEWLATDGWDDLLAAWINEDVVLNLEGLAAYKFSDSSLRDTEGLDGAEAVTDQMRVDYAREAISYEVENCEGDDSPSVHSFSIERDDGERAVLGCTVEIHGQYGEVPRWHGVFADTDGFYRHLRAAGFLFHSEADEIGDAEILALWDFEKKKIAKRKKRSS